MTDAVNTLNNQPHTSSIHVLQARFGAGAIDQNVQTILSAAARASEAGAQLLLTPALAVCGGMTVRSLLQMPDFIAACQAAFERIVTASQAWPNLTICLGHPHWMGEDDKPFNTISAIRAGQVIARQHAHFLHSTAPMNERRYFRSAMAEAWADDRTGQLAQLRTQVCIVQTADGTPWGLIVGRDAWSVPLGRATREAGAAGLLVCGGWDWRWRPETGALWGAELAQTGARLGQDEGGASLDADWTTSLVLHAQALRYPVVCANAVGGFDAHVFAGGSFAVDATGAVTARAVDFQEQTLIAHYTPAPLQTNTAPAHDQTVFPEESPLRCEGIVALPPSSLEGCWRALVCAVRDYAHTNGFSGIAIGLSGGVDSALVLALAVDAVGADKVRTLMMPSPFTSQISLDDAAEMARRLGVRHDSVGIEPLMQTFANVLAPIFTPSGVTHENLQARSRGTLLMALSNQEGRLVLSTSNKSESAVGYSTLYGDMVGGFAPIKDLLKTQVFQLARWRNAHDPFGAGANPIPERIITRAPSAELRPDQRDEDSLLPYPVLDDILARHLHQGQSRAQLIEAGHRSADVDKVLRLIRASEYKRAQGPLGPFISRTHLGAFGPRWDMPMSHGFLPTEIA